MTEVFLVRHGQAAFGTDNYDRLSDRGRQQAWLLGRYLSNRSLAFDRVMLGTLRRHRETQEAIGSAFSESIPVTETPDLDEYNLRNIVRSWRDQTDCSDRGSRSIEEFYRVAGSALRAWSNDKLPRAPDNWAVFRGRICTVLEEIGDSSAHRMLVVTSGGPISVFLQETLKLTADVMVDLNLELANTGVTRLVVKHQTRRLISFNSTAHLENSEDESLVTYL